MKNRKYIPEDIESYNKLKVKPLLFVRGLTKKYKGRRFPAITKLDFDVYPGEFHAFIGANGAGKTTTFKSLIGAYNNWDGTILINGKNNNTEDAKRKLGYIPENARFPSKFTTLEYLIAMTRLSGRTKEESITIATSKLKELKLWELRNKSPNTFSSGQKKKVLLAQALIHDPDVILMDEPVANLDPTARAEFYETLLKLKKQGKALFLSSHVLAELDKYFDSITILDGGKVIYTGKRDTIIKEFMNDQYTLKFSAQQKLIKYLNDKKIKFTEDSNKGLVASFKKTTDITDLISKLAAQHVYPEYISKSTPDLDRIYASKIIKGSVDQIEQKENKN